MIIFGIDPGINAVGYGIIKLNDYNNISYLKSGIIRTSVVDLLHVRLGIITCQIEELLSQFKPDLVGMEEVFINRNAASSIKLSHARGAIMGVIGRNAHNFKELSPNKIKQILTGNGHADKTQVAYMVKLLIKGINKEVIKDESDALAIAYALSIQTNY